MASTLKETVNIYSMNCQGLRNNDKRKDVINYLKLYSVDILCLQDTHLKTSEVNLLKDLWEGKVILHGINTNSRGVAILFKETFQCDILHTLQDEDGNMLTLQIKHASKNILLINAYGPNTDNPMFFESIKKHIDAIDHDHFILCGDLNVSLNYQKDTCN